jgi:hypothetical protein
MSYCDAIRADSCRSPRSAPSPGRPRNERFSETVSGWSRRRSGPRQCRRGPRAAPTCWPRTTTSVDPRFCRAEDVEPGAQVALTTPGPHDPRFANWGWWALDVPGLVDKSHNRTNRRLMQSGMWSTRSTLSPLINEGSGRPRPHLASRMLVLSGPSPGPDAAGGRGCAGWGLQGDLQL